jgi:DNA primase
MLRPLSPSVRDSLEKATAQYQKHLGVAEGYLQARGIGPELARDFRLGVVVDPVAGHERMRGRLAIPSLGPGGAPYALRFRSLDGGDPKYLGLPGVDLRLYNVRALHDAGDAICITEGELDTISLAACGLQAVAVPGVKSWKAHHLRLFAGFSKVFIWGDGDDPGREFAQKLSREIDTSIVVNLPDGEDVNSILVQGGPEAIRSMI